MGYFLSIEIPDQVVAALQKYELPDDECLHIQRREDLHITLAYIGHVTDKNLADLEHHLNNISHEEFTIQGQGAHYFGPGPGYRNHFFTAQITRDDHLQGLKDKIDDACQAAGLEPTRLDREYNPHITLARSDHQLSAGVIDKFKSENVQKTIPPFDVLQFSLYKSHHPKPYKKISDFKLGVEE